MLRSERGPAFSPVSTVVLIFTHFTGMHFLWRFVYPLPWNMHCIISMERRREQRRQQRVAFNDYISSFPRFCAICTRWTSLWMHEHAYMHSKSDMCIQTLTQRHACACAFSFLSHMNAVIAVKTRTKFYTFNWDIDFIWIEDEVNQEVKTTGRIWSKRKRILKVHSAV